MTSTHASFSIPLTQGSLELGPHPLVMGIVNVTPDSFSDGGDHFDTKLAVSSALDMQAKRADVIDIGGESTRPGADDVSVQDELDRVMPVLDALATSDLGLPISIDTRHAVVAHQALQAGASIVNDVEGLQGEPELAEIASAFDAPVIAMHWDRDRDTTKDIIGEIKRWFSKTIDIAQKAGLPQEKLILDPGFGFAKSFQDNYTILRRLSELNELGLPVLVGTSRKSMFGKLLGVAPKQRVSATVASTVMGYVAGAHIFRVHDVTENRDALRVAEASLYGPPPPIETD